MGSLDVRGATFKANSAPTVSGLTRKREEVLISINCLLLLLMNLVICFVFDRGQTFINIQLVVLLTAVPRRMFSATTLFAVNATRLEISPMAFVALITFPCASTA
jgi:hypothetical protein